MKTRSLAIVLATIIAAACDRHSPGPSPLPGGGTTAPPVDPVASLVRVTATGNTNLAAVGDTTQLTATAQLSDGTTKDLAGLAAWVSADPVTIDVSRTGLATARRLGSAYVYFTYQGKQSGLTVKSTPPGTFVISGRVREPGNGGIADLAIQLDTGGTLTTRTEGLYTMGGLTGTVRLSIAAGGFEPVSVVATPDVYQDIPLQRVVRLSEGHEASFTLAPHDVEYLLAPDVMCSPCRRVHLSVGFTGTLELAASWTEPRAKVNIWVKDRNLITEGPCTQITSGTLSVTPGEFELYVGMSGSTGDFYVPITVVARAR